MYEPPAGDILGEQMFARRSAPDASYTLSQLTTRCPVPPSAVARGLADCSVVVADRAQVHEHDGRRLQSKTYGYYRCRFSRGSVTDARIRVYHRTAVRQQVISSKVFLNTVLHEWMHHFDFAGLKLERSPHTAGFFARLRDLADTLDVGFVLPPEPEPATATAAHH